MSAAEKMTGLFFGPRPDSAAAARRAAEMLRARGYAVTERAGNHISTNAPYKVAIDIKRRAWTAAEQARSAPTVAETKDEWIDRHTRCQECGEVLLLGDGEKAWCGNRHDLSRKVTA